MVDRALIPDQNFVDPAGYTGRGGFVDVQEQASFKQSLLSRRIPLQACGKESGAALLATGVKRLIRCGSGGTRYQHGGSEAQKLSSGACNKPMMRCPGPK